MAKQKKRERVESVYSDKPAKKPAADVGPAEGPDLSYIAEGLRPLAVPIDTVQLDPNNVNVHPEKSISAIAGSLTAYGQRVLVVVNKTSGLVEKGHGTVEAARSLSWSHIAVLFVEDDPATASGFALADNRSAALSHFDKEKLKKVLHGISTKNDARLDQMMADLSKEKNLFGEREPAKPKQPVAFDASKKPLELVVTCETEEEREELLARLRKEGWQVRKEGA